MSTSPQKELSAYTNQELLDEVKKLKSFSITNAFVIGFLIGVIIYSVIENTWGLLTLIPLYLIHKFANDPKNKRLEEIEELIKDRGIK
jgi:hypothetical protein